VPQSTFAASSEKFHVRTARNVSLGTLRLAIRSNEEQFSELRYFPEGVTLPDDSPVHYSVNCCNLNVDGPWPLDALSRARDRTYRGGRFAGGYYLTDHFGPPAYIVTTGQQLWIFAERFEPILWPFVVKYLLTIHSLDEQLLHLKAACVAFDGAGTLLVGRGGSGKTVLLTQLCRAGAKFLANTHALLRGQTVFAVPTSMRVRNDSLFEAVIAARKLTTGIKPGEYVADPIKDLLWETVATTDVRNICLVDYKGVRHCQIQELEADVLYEYMENFSLAVNLYGLKEDVFDYLGGDARRLAKEWAHMKTMLRSLVDRCRCHYVSADMMDAACLAELRKRLVS
jgi:hypothetical protein